MKADKLTGSRVAVGDGLYQYTFKFASGAHHVFTCRNGEEFAQLNWRMQGGRGLSPEILANRKTQLANREIDAANRVLEGEDEDDVEEDQLAEQQRLQNRERSSGRAPSGMTIAQRNRIAKLEAAFKDKQNNPH